MNRKLVGYLLGTIMLIEAACMVHGTDADELVEKINAYLSKK